VRAKETEISASLSAVEDSNTFSSGQASGSTLGVFEHSSSFCCSNPNELTLLLCISVYAVLVDVLMHAVDLHKTASR